MLCGWCNTLSMQPAVLVVPSMKTQVKYVDRSNRKRVYAEETCVSHVHLETGCHASRSNTIHFKQQSFVDAMMTTEGATTQCRTHLVKATFIT